MRKKFSKIKHLFFDLDHTLWDFEANARICLEEIYRTHQLAELGVPNHELFADTFSEVNQTFWYLLDTKQITHETLRRERFRSTLSDLGFSIEYPLSEAMNAQFLELLPEQTSLMPHAVDTLEMLSKKYQLHIISNGYEHIQRKKLEKSGLLPYFKAIVTNDVANAHKPSPAIFSFALQMTGSSHQQSVMIGDNWTADIQGAIQSNIFAVHFDPTQKGKVTSEYAVINSLHHLPSLLDS